MLSIGGRMYNCRARTCLRELLIRYGGITPDDQSTPRPTCDYNNVCTGNVYLDDVGSARCVSRTKGRQRHTCQLSPVKPRY